MTAEQRLTKLLLQASGDLQKLYDQLIKELTKATSNSVHAVSPDELYTILIAKVWNYTMPCKFHASIFQRTECLHGLK